MGTSPRKRIALLLGHPEEFSHKLFLKGFLEEAFKKDYDVCVFGMYVKYQNTPAREIGDSSIFRIVNYSSFDLIVVMADTIQTKGESERIEEDLHKKYKGKVIFVDKESKYFPSVHIDNYTPAKAVIDHLIEVHNMRNIAFLTGKAWHPHSKIRLKAYEDSLREHGIEPSENNIFYGDFWYTSGESLADSFASSSAPLPEAVACANDCMALGFAKGMTSRGYKIPDDIAIVGCDCNEEGRHAPIPLTSSKLLYDKLGKDTALTAHSLITGADEIKTDASSDLFIGGTCGCGCDSAKPFYPTRVSWDTEISLGTMFSPFNHFDEDLMNQTNFTGLIGTIFASVPLIKGFDSFGLCLNPGLGSSPSVFEDKLLEVISCGSENENNDRIMVNNLFEKEKMLPNLFDERPKPSVFYFMPLFWDDSVFGYAAVEFRNRANVPSAEYRAWLRSICKGIECYRRSDAIIGSSSVLKRGIMTDDLTGLYNYKGFLNEADTFLNLMKNRGNHMGAIAVDIKDLSHINDNYGRKEGDRAIISVANVLEGLFKSDNCLCIRIGNDELVGLRITRDPGDTELLEQKDLLVNKLKELSRSEGLPYGIDLYCGILSGVPADIEDVERLVNLAISRKNADKERLRKLTARNALSDEEQKTAEIVSGILDDNRIKYHFQPIVDAKSGKIYAYEALMRPDVTPYLPPPVILRYAEFYNRLYDVEKITFHNVINTIKMHSNILSDGRKVFINSLPGYMLKGDDLLILNDYAVNNPGTIVIEFTEHSQMSDDLLNDMKTFCEKSGFETAVDDYGTGYSNISNLLRYTPDYVKIDRALISGIEDSPQKQHFVKDIIVFSHDNGIKALAEGIETASELKTVIELGADLIQGYYTARPAAEMLQSIDYDIISEIRGISKPLGSS